MSGLEHVVEVAELLRRPGTRKDVRVTLEAEGVVVGEARVPDGSPVEADLVLESMADGIVVSGTLDAPWEAPCRRCLGPATGHLHVEVRELFQHEPTSEFAYPFDGEQLDLATMVHEALGLDLPLAPLCRPDCLGLCVECGANRNEVDCGHRPDTSDPRWAALGELRGRLEQDGP